MPSLSAANSGNMFLPMVSRFDLCIIGGGVNGTAIARDAAGRGYAVLLLEKGDLAGATSSSSTKLVHGGLRYLETYQFRLVRESLIERGVLLKSAPHIIRPLRFVLPHAPHLRPAWMIRAGLFLYDHLAPLGAFAKSRGEKREGPAYAPLARTVTRAFSYSDGWVDDARLTVLQALDAKLNGAVIKTRNGAKSLRPHDGHWLVTDDGGTQYQARMVVNATGPWVRRLLDDAGLATPATPKIKLVRGSHIVVPRLYDGDHAYILQNEDRRIVFTIPYEGAFTLIGTTDAPHGDDPSVAPVISDAERDYLLDVASRWLQKTVTQDDIMWAYSGVRPLVDDGDAKLSRITRDYKLVGDEFSGTPILSVFGGKLTTARALADHALVDIEAALGAKAKPWTRAACLPGGDLARPFDAFVDDVMRRHPYFTPQQARRLAHAYGTRLDMFASPHMGRAFGDSLTQAEVEYMKTHEWAVSSDDILWRRSKLGLHADPEMRAALKEYLGEKDL